MREIKFRTWNKIAQCMESWENMVNHGNFYRILDNYEYPVMQYIGHRDLNGISIYEGDIVKWGHIEGFTELTPRIAIVRLHPALNFSTTNLGANDHDFHYGNFAYKHSIDKAMEVIGNIHQNPELLEVNNGKTHKHKS